MKAIIYIRVSTNHQSSGITTQLTACQKKAHELGSVEQVVFTDTATHHGTPLENRSGLLKAFLALRPKDIFIVYSSNRISRDIVLLTRFNYILKKSDVTLVYIEQSETLLQKEVEVEYKNQQTKYALQQLRVEKNPYGIIPYGLKLAANETLEHSTYEQSVIEFIGSCKSSGYSLRAILNRLNNNGLTDRKGSSFQLTQVARIVKKLPEHPMPSEKKKSKLTLYGFRYGIDGKTIEIAPDEQKVIKLILALRHDKMPIRSIVIYINAAGCRSRTGNIFGLKQVSTILKRNLKNTKQPIAKYGFAFSKETESISPDKYEQKIITVAQGLRLEGHSLRSIAFELNKQGHRSRRGNNFTITQIRSFIANTPEVEISKTLGRSNISYGWKYENNSIELCIYEQNVIKVILELHFAGLSLAAIITELNRSNYYSRAKKPFHVFQIRRIIKQNKKSSQTYRQVTHGRSQTSV